MYVYSFYYLSYKEIWYGKTENSVHAKNDSAIDNALRNMALSCPTVLGGTTANLLILLQTQKDRHVFIKVQTQKSRRV